MSEPDLTTAGTWHDQAPAVSAAALATMRLDSSDPDGELVGAKALTACQLIDDYVDLRAMMGRVHYASGGRLVTTWATDAAPGQVMDAAVAVTVELYKRKDAPFGVLADGGIGGEPTRISSDPLAGVAHLLNPYREGWGIG